jgi:thioesterase domain-containing protein
MDTLVDYILWMRDIPFAVLPFREADALTLCLLSYFDFSPLFAEEEAVPLKRAKTLLEQGKARIAIAGGDMGYLDILAAAADSRRFGDILMGDYEDILEEEPPLQFSALTFRWGEEAFLAYRGTDSTLAGWEEDCMISFTHTPSQELALDYARKVLGPGLRWRMGGHSKGGNLALYAAGSLPRGQLERVEQIYLLDAPGLCPEVVGDGFFDGIEEKICRIIPQFCIVGKIFETKVPNTAIVPSTASGVLQHALSTWGIDHGALARAERCDPISLWLDQVQEQFISGLSREERVTFFREVFDALGSGGARTLEDLADEGLNGYKSVREHLKAHASESTRRILADLPRQALRSGLENIHQELPRQARSGLDSLHHKHLTPERQAHLAQLPRQALRTGLDTLNSLRPARSAPQAEESQGSYPLLRGRWIENGKQPRDGGEGAD